MIRLSRRSLWLALGLWAASLGQVQAADPATDLDEVLVTATRTQIALRDSLSPAQVIGRAEIERSQATSLQQLLAGRAGINLTNTAARSETGESLTALLARRDCLKMKLGLYREFLQNASDVVPRGLRTEIRIVSTVKVSQMQKQVDDMSRDLRLLEETIQSLNWTTELQ